MYFRYSLLSVFFNFPQADDGSSSNHPLLGYVRSGTGSHSLQGVHLLIGCSQPCKLLLIFLCHEIDLEACLNVLVLEGSRRGWILGKRVHGASQKAGPGRSLEAAVF